MEHALNEIAAIERLRDEGWRIGRSPFADTYALSRGEEQREVDMDALIAMASELPTRAMTYKEAVRRALLSLRRELADYEALCPAERSGIDRYELRMAIAVLSREPAQMALWEG